MRESLSLCRNFPLSEAAQEQVQTLAKLLSQSACRSHFVCSLLVTSDELKGTSVPAGSGSRKPSTSMRDGQEFSQPAAVQPAG